VSAGGKSGKLKELPASGAFAFENIVLPPPPGAVGTAEEIEVLRGYQRDLRADRTRQAEIVRQIFANNPIDILRPLGIEQLGGYSATRALIQTVLQMTERVGYLYKTRFARPRPSAIDPTLRPFLPNPPHPAYPSNHSFQNFAVAEVLSRAVPENPATTELFHVARRIGENREYAGLHYPSDTNAGEILARRMAPYLLYVCRSQVRSAQREWY